MQPSCKVRRLRHANTSDLRGLNHLFGTVFDQSGIYDGEPPSEAYLQRLLSKDHVIALVADVSGEIAGGLIAYELEFSNGSDARFTSTILQFPSTTGVRESRRLSSRISDKSLSCVEPGLSTCRLT